MCSNPDCGNIRRVVGVCPECGSPAKDLGFKEGTALIKLKKENMNRKNDETAAEAQKIIDQMEMEAADKEDDTATSNGDIETVPPGEYEVEGDKNAENKAERDEPAEKVVKSSKGWIYTLLKILVFVVFVIIFYIMFIYILN